MARGAEYFDVFFPYSSVQVGQRFFFFNSLFEKSKILNSGQTVSTYAPLLAYSAQKIINNGLNKLEQPNNNDTTIMEQALQFLKDMANHQAAEEKAFFTKKVSGNDEITTILRDKLMACYDGDTIDYLNFIKFINEFYQGGEEFKDILAQETSRLNDLNKAYEAYRQWLKDNYNKTNLRKMHNDFKKRHKRKEGDTMTPQYYLSNEDIFYNEFYSFIKQSDIFKDKYFELRNSKTIANKIQDRLNSIYNRLMKDQRIVEIIASQIQNQATIEKVKPAIVAYLVEQFNALNLSALEKDIQNQAISSSESKRFNDQLANYIVNSLKLAEEGSEVISEADLLSRLNTAQARQILSDVEKIANDATALERIEGRYIKRLGFNVTGTSFTNEKAGGFTGITKDLIEALKPIVGNEKVKTSIKAKDGEVARTDRAIILDQVLAYLKRTQPALQLFKNGRLNRELIADEINKLIADKTTVEFNPGKGMGAEGVVTGQLREAAAQIIGNTIGINDASSKNDTVFLELGDVVIGLPKNISENITNIIANDFEQSLQRQDMDLEIFDKNGLKHIFNEKKTRDTLGFEDNEFFLEGETKRRIALLQNSFNEIKKNLTNINDANEKQLKALNILKGTFSVGASVKNYDKYDNTKGFHGGSLGGSVENQLTNIETMLSYGGITPPEHDWLVFSVYNSGAGMVGSGAKKSLEDLFSTVAIMMLFDDAGVQAQYISQQAQEYMTPVTGSIHLYNLNGVYVPESFVLKLTYNGLVEAENKLAEVAGFNSSGSRASIINNVTEAQMQGALGRNTVTSSSDWFTTFEKNKGQVSINITFLAGFLDILNQLNNMMSNPTASA